MTPSEWLASAAIVYVAAVFGLIARYLATGRKPWRPWRWRADAHGFDHIVGASAIDTLTALAVWLAGGPPIAVFFGGWLFGRREVWQHRRGKTWDNTGYWYPVVASIVWSLVTLAIAYAQMIISIF